MRNFFAVILMCLGLSGCVLGSVNPFYTSDLVVDKPELYGDWKYEQNPQVREDSLITIAQGRITVSDKDNSPADSRLTFFEVNGDLFVDLYPDQGQLKIDLVGDGVPVHLICKVIYKNGRLLFNPLDYEWLVKEAESGAINISFKKLSSDDNADVILTASPEQWVEFLKVHHANPQAFPLMDEGWLIRK